MFLTETNVLAVTCKQYLVKLKAVSFSGLVILQAVILVFWTGGMGMYGASNVLISLSVRNYSSDIVIIATMIWALALAIMQTKKQAKNMDFTLVSNRLTSCLSDIGILATISFLGALTSVFSGMLQRLLMYFALEHSTIINSSFKPPLAELALDVVAVALYIFLIAAGGYLFGMLLEISRLFAFLIPALILGLARGQNNYFTDFLGFYITETSLLLFAGKVLLTSALCFALSILIYNRMEVRR
ncbi:MAG TPA: hypothetical protein GXX46_05845 [Peptococcaceae bacterium]|nr:hypothetical protein [Peptococcaceae bacterium]